MLIPVLTALALSGDSWTADWITIRRPSTAVETASWIWAHEEGSPLPTRTTAPEGKIFLRHGFEVSGVVKRATLSVAADNSAEVFLNGLQVHTCSDWSTIDRADVAKALVAGRNEIRIEATNDPGVALGNPAGLLIFLEWESADGRVGKLVSDSSWEASLDEQFRDRAQTVVIGPFSSPPWNLRTETPHPPMFRKEFSLPAKTNRTTVRIVGLGDYELYVNGQLIGDTKFNQPWSQYDKTLFWREFDVTAVVRPGSNAVGVMLGNSFWNVGSPGDLRYTKGDAMPDFGKERPFLLRIEVRTEAPGRESKVAGTDRSWRFANSPTTYSHIFGGEDFDARLEQAGWSSVGFDDSGWTPAQIASPPSSRLVRQSWPGIKVHEVFEPTKWVRLAADKWSACFAQNCSGVVELQVSGPRGAVVTLRPSEVISAEGEVQQLNLWGRQTVFRYTLAGRGVEKWQWKFHYHGFQFVEVAGAVPKGEPNPDGLPTIHALRLLHTRAALPEVGTFECSSELYNRTHSLVDWAMRSNMSHVLTDCPHREKLGWLECSYLLAPTFSYRFRTDAWFQKICMDIRDSQQPDGRVCTVAPRFLTRPPDDYWSFTVEWGAAGVLLPWHMYEWYGDRRILEESYASMKAFTEHVGAIAKDHIAPGVLGDWYDYGHGQPPGPSRFTPQDLSATATWAMCADAVSKAARILLKTEDEKRFAALRRNIESAFLSKFYDPVAKKFAHHGSPQAGHSMALVADLVPRQDRDDVLNAVLDDLSNRDYQQTAGDVGHVYFIRALANAGRSDVLHKVYSRTGTGSYGGILEKGLTTMPETWDAITVGSNSLNHCMLGHVIEWFYGWVLGIRQKEGTVGWNDVWIAPEPGPLEHARGKFESPRGAISVSWRSSPHEFVLEATVPQGIRASLVAPSGALRLTTLNGKPVTSPSAGPFGRKAVNVGSGKFILRCARP